MILDEIVADKKRRLVEHKMRQSIGEIRRLAKQALQENGVSTLFFDNLKKPGISIIGEFKKASPSLGNITSKISLSERIEDYSASVDAISCLTEEDHFHGCVEDFLEIRSKTDLPMIRKDFMIDEYQFYEAKAIGANAILLIAAILDDEQMKAFYQLATELGMDALVETHDEHEMERALKLDAKIIGVNNRNLKDFTISLDNTVRLRPMVPKDKVFVAESGILTDADIRLLKDCEADAFLIGRALMEADDPRAVAKHWKEL